MIRTTRNHVRRALTRAKIGVLLVIAYVLLIPTLLTLLGVVCWVTYQVCQIIYHVLGAL